MKNRLINKTYGFTLLEIIVAIVIMSIVSVAVLESLTQPIEEKIINNNDLGIIVKNIDEIYYSILKKYGPEAVDGYSFSINGFTKDCSEEIESSSIEYMLCKSNIFGDNVKYSINSISSISTTNAPPLLPLQSWDVNYSVIFYYRKSTSGPWIEHMTIDRTLRVTQ